MIEECLPLHVAERDNTWMAGIEYLFSQDNGATKNYRQQRMGPTTGAERAYTLFSTPSWMAETRAGKKGRWHEVNNFGVCTETLGTGTLV